MEMSIMIYVLVLFAEQQAVDGETKTRENQLFPGTTEAARSRSTE